MYFGQPAGKKFAPGFEIFPSNLVKVYSLIKLLLTFFQPTCFSGRREGSLDKHARKFLLKVRKLIKQCQKRISSFLTNTFQEIFLRTFGTQFWVQCWKKPMLKKVRWKIDHSQSLKNLYCNEFFMRIILYAEMFHWPVWMLLWQPCWCFSDQKRSLIVSDSRTNVRWESIFKSFPQK